MIYDLDCRYSTRKSFYGKAKVRVIEDSEERTIKELISYTTHVATYEYDKVNNIKTYKYLGHYSMTTTTHQKEFFKQEGLNNDEIKKLFKDYELVIGE